jgi:glycine betaine/proline transport system substrate-binding protein
VEFGPNYGGATVYTIARRGYAEACPNVAKLFSQMKYDIDFENTGMQMVTGDGKEFADAAKAMLAKRPELLDAWLKDVTTLDGKPALPAVKAALGM